MVWRAMHRGRLRDRYALVGVGQSPLGRLPNISAADLAVEAIKQAIDDAGIEIGEVDGLICQGPREIYCLHQVVGSRLGINARFSTSLDNGGASQALSVILAILAVDAGLASTVVCACTVDAWSKTHSSEAARVRNDTRAGSGLREFGPEYGYSGAAASHALGAQRHMALYGTTREHFAEIAIQIRDYASRNPAASLRKPLTRDEYFSARLIVEPFGLYDCSLRSDGAAAVVVTARDRATDTRRQPVSVKGFGTFNNLKGWIADDNMVRTAAAPSGAAAYKMAGLGPADVDLVQLYDCFTYMVLVQLEDYGFCEKGEGGSFVASGALGIGGATPCNTSGGLLSEAHVEGMLHICEAVRQLRRELPQDRQVPDVEIALVSGHGGNQVCHATLVLGRA